MSTQIAAPHNGTHNVASVHGKVHAASYIDAHGPNSRAKCGANLGRYAIPVAKAANQITCERCIAKQAAKLGKTVKPSALEVAEAGRLARRDLHVYDRVACVARITRTEAQEACEELRGYGIEVQTHGDEKAIVRTLAALRIVFIDEAWVA